MAYNGTASYVYTTASNTTYQTPARITIEPSPPPVHLTEVDRLLADVDVVCALARVA